MVCPNCKNKIDDGVPFCYFCGETFDENFRIDESQEKKKNTSDERKKRMEEFRAEQRAREEELKQKLNSMIIVSAPILDGYKIKEYIGMVSGEFALGSGPLSEFFGSISDFMGGKSRTFSNILAKAKDGAMKDMALRALNMGADGVIAVDIDINVLGNNMILVSANGTAVKFEKKTEAIKQKKVVQKAHNEINS